MLSKVLNGVNGINTNTYVSLGVLFTILIASWTINTSVNSTRNAITNRLDKTEARILVLETNKDIWTDADMFKWAVHLQRENPTLKVPEPEMHNK